MEIRHEHPSDIPGIHAVNTAAFGRPGEADLVNALRASAHPFFSLVAVEKGTIIGHIAFSPLTFDRDVKFKGLGLAPVAVLPEWQKKGIGTKLIRAGLEACHNARADFVVLIGHPEYYPRFDFAPAREKGLQCEYEVPDNVFMVREMRPGVLPITPALVVRYHEAFKNL